MYRKVLFVLFLTGVQGDTSPDVKHETPNGTDTSPNPTLSQPTMAAALNVATNTTIAPTHESENVTELPQTTTHSTENTNAAAIPAPEKASDTSQPTTEESKANKTAIVATTDVAGQENHAIDSTQQSGGPENNTNVPNGTTDQTTKKPTVDDATVKANSQNVTSDVTEHTSEDSSLQGGKDASSDGTKPNDTVTNETVNKTTEKPPIVPKSTAGNVPVTTTTVTPPSTTINEKEKTENQTIKTGAQNDAAASTDNDNSGVPKWKVILLTFLILVGGAGSVVLVKMVMNTDRGRLWRQQWLRRERSGPTEVQYLVIKDHDEDL